MYTIIRIFSYRYIYIYLSDSRKNGAIFYWTRTLSLGLYPRIAGDSHILFQPITAISSLLDLIGPLPQGRRLFGPTVLESRSRNLPIFSHDWKTNTKIKIALQVKLYFLINKYIYFFLLKLMSENAFFYLTSLKLLIIVSMHFLFYIILTALYCSFFFYIFL